MGLPGLFVAGYASVEAVARLRRTGAGDHCRDTYPGVVWRGSCRERPWCSQRPVLAWLGR